MAIFSRRDFSVVLGTRVDRRTPPPSRVRHRKLQYESLDGRNLLGGDPSVTGAPLQNPVNPLDTNNDYAVSPIDALIILNQMAIASGQGETDLPHPAEVYPDVNGDQLVTSVVGPDHHSQ